MNNNTPVDETGSAPVPESRGPVSAALLDLLCGTSRDVGDSIDEISLETADPYGEDVQLALQLCYELHYRGLERVNPRWEWDPRVVGLRGRLEAQFEAALRRDVPGGTDLDAELDELLTEPAEPAGVGGFLQEHGQWWQLREYFVHRSIYHHKEADPYAWAIPRLTGQAKASLVAVEFDEFGAGRGDKIHAVLYADLLSAAGLRRDYSYYLDAVPAPMLAVVNMMSLLGLHRRLRGALAGHFAAVEITSSPGSRRLVDILRRMGAAQACVRFYAEHVAADAVHEQVMRRGVLEPLLLEQPALLESVVFGIQATGVLEERFDRHLLGCWRAGHGSLRPSLTTPADSPAAQPAQGIDMG
ncbi:MAG: iron-containing redox enzyme family protein [Mycobacteriaceae bacterium]|nr:iron-containing redox enzyme family protein [Mycobacteriaceae bacterium]